MSAQKIFISYRREDCAGHAGRLCDRLDEAFGEESVFRDVEDIAAGEDFIDTLHAQIDQCSVLLALIGPRWLGATDAAGQRRLDNEHDWVRREIARGLARGIRVIPVLLQGATLPSAAELPDDLADLPRRQAVELRDTQFDRDAELLIQHLAPSHQLLNRYRLAIAALLAALIGVGAYALYPRHQSAPPPAVAAQAPSDTALEWLLRHGLPTHHAGLMKAIYEGNDAIVEQYLLARIDPNDVAPDAESALVAAVERGKPRTVELLLHHGADVEGALEVAIREGRDDIISLLLAQPLPTAEIQKGFAMAAHQGRLDDMKRLVALGATPNGDHGEPLLSAVQNVQVEAVRWLLERKAKPELVALNDNRSLLHEAAALKHRDSDGSRSDAIVAALLDAGLDPNLQATGATQLYPTALLVAIQSRNVPVALRLLEHTAKIDTRTRDRAERTALHLAAASGLPEVTDALLQRGAELDARDHDDRTPLMTAAAGGDAATVNLLLSRRPDLSARDREGRTVLMHAVHALQVEVVGILLAAGADVTKTTSTGDTALHVLAARFEDRDTYPARDAVRIAALLMAKGAERGAKNANGETPLALARRYKFQDLVGALESP